MLGLFCLFVYFSCTDQSTFPMILSCDTGGFWNYFHLSSCKNLSCIMISIMKMSGACSVQSPADAAHAHTLELLWSGGRSLRAAVGGSPEVQHGRQEGLVCANLFSVRRYLHADSGFSWCSCPGDVSGRSGGSAEL